MFKKFPTCVHGLKLLLVNLLAVIALPALFSTPSGRATTTAHAAPLPRIRVNAIPAFREEVWSAVFRLSHRMARAEQFRAGVPR